MKKKLFFAGLIVMVVGFFLFEVNDNLAAILVVGGILFMIFGPLMVWAINKQKQIDANKKINKTEMIENGWIKKCDGFFISEKLELVKINGNQYSFNDILDAELLVDGGTITKTDSGSAIARTLLFGGIIGGTTAKRKTQDYCNELRIKITLNSISNPIAYINFINGGKIRKDGLIYKNLANTANECLSIFNIIINKNKQ